MKMATVLRIPEWEHATDSPVPETGWWKNQHDEPPLWLTEGLTFPPCRNGDRAHWFLVSTTCLVDSVI